MRATHATSVGLQEAHAGFFARLMAKLRAARGNSELDLASYRLLVASLFTSPTSIVVSNMVGTGVPYFCWYVTGEPLFFAFTVVAALTIALRFMTVTRYCSMDHANDTLAEVKQWDREYFIGATLFSTILGANCFSALVFTENQAAHIITVVSAIAFASGYVARNSGRPFFVVIQLMCFSLPMAIGLFMSGEPYLPGIGAFILLYIVTNVSIIFSINRNHLALAAAYKTSEQLAETLRRKNMTLDSALNSMTHGLTTFDADLRVEVSNFCFRELYGLSQDDVRAGSALEQITLRMVNERRISSDAARDIGSVCERVLRFRQPAVIEFLTASQQTFVVSVEPIQDGGILMLTEDATVRKATAAQIEHMAHYDSLTGLANRFTLGTALNDACSEARGDLHLSVLYIDLDNFKQINDSLGHDSGDKLLVQTAQRLQRIAGRDDLVARFGGDEFVLLHFAPDVEAATAMGRQIVEAMTLPFNINGLTMYVTTSVGVAFAPEHGSNPADVLRAADIALYAAKARGRNTVISFEPSMDEELRRRREIENDLREACQKGSLFLHYQPIVQLPSQRIATCEALMRWQHPVKGMIPPGVFIPIAEQTGLIVQMGEWAIRRACMDAATWPEDVSVAVNVSAFQFKDTARLIETVKDALLMSRLAPSRLEIEVTESLLIEDQKATLEAIRALRRIGVKFSLDDFGVGYSSLAYLAQYPFSKVKIDRTFAKDITTSGPSRSIVETVCRLARDLGLSVVVEGIETEEQQREVEHLGIEQAQGYLFGKPAAADVLMPRFRRSAAA